MIKRGYNVYIFSIHKPREDIIHEEINTYNIFNRTYYFKLKYIFEENILKVEKIKDVYIFYVAKNKKGEVIGKNASNIKSLRKKYGQIVIKTI